MKLQRADRKVLYYLSWMVFLISILLFHNHWFGSYMFIAMVSWQLMAIWEAIHDRL